MLRQAVTEITTPTELIGLARRRRELAALPDGDGHTVLIAPGLLATDASTTLLRRFLRGKNLDARGWGLGRNLGSVDLFERYVDVVAETADRAEGPVALVGWSLGGIASRYAAAKRPDAVRQVITLGSPFQVDPRTRAIYPLYKRVSGADRGDFTEERLRAVMDTPTVPATSIVARDDLLVAPDDGRQDAGPTSETLMVSGGHFGLGINPEVWAIVADRLALPAGAWEPYDRPRAAA